MHFIIYYYIFFLGEPSCSDNRDNQRIRSLYIDSIVVILLTKKLFFFVILDPLESFLIVIFLNMPLFYVAHNTPMRSETPHCLTICGVLFNVDIFFSRDIKIFYHSILTQLLWSLTTQSTPKYVSTSTEQNCRIKISNMVASC